MVSDNIRNKSEAFKEGFYGELPTHPIDGSDSALKYFKDYDNGIKAYNRHLEKQKLLEELREERRRNRKKKRRVLGFVLPKTLSNLLNWLQRPFK